LYPFFDFKDFHPASITSSRMANPRMQKLQANIKADLKAIDKRFASPAGDGEPLEPKNESPWKLELKPFIDNMASGQLGPNDQAYCPIHLLSRLPVKFLADQLSSDVIEKFYNAGKFWERSWVLYMIPHLISAALTDLDTTSGRSMSRIPSSSSPKSS
jgi:hypothetical protein